MTDIRKSAPIHLVVHSPEPEVQKQALACRVARIHADTVLAGLKEWNCPAGQKQELLDTLVHTVKNREQDP